MTPPPAPAEPRPRPNAPGSRQADVAVEDGALSQVNDEPGVLSRLACSHEATGGEVGGIRRHRRLRGVAAHGGVPIVRGHDVRSPTGRRRGDGRWLVEAALEGIGVGGRQLHALTSADLDDNRRGGCLGAGDSRCAARQQDQEQQQAEPQDHERENSVPAVFKTGQTPASTSFTAARILRLRGRTMTASVVTFSMQLGAGGRRIARGVAEKLRFRYYDWEVIAQAAAEAGVSPEVLAVATSERSPSFLERVMSRLAGPPSGESPASAEPLPSSLLTSDDYSQFLDRVVQELGNRGEAVIVNHAAQVRLARLPGVLKVLVVGSQEQRARRLAQARGSGLASARKTLEDSDKQRTDFFKRVYHIDWLGMNNYDLALNTDLVSVELAVDMVAAAAREVR